MSKQWRKSIKTVSKSVKTVKKSVKTVSKQFKKVEKQWENSVKQCQTHKQKLSRLSPAVEPVVQLFIGKGLIFSFSRKVTKVSWECKSFLNFQYLHKVKWTQKKII